MKKFIFVLSTVMIALSVSANEPAVVNMKLAQGSPREMKLYVIEDGKFEPVVTWINDQSGYFSIGFIPPYEGFYGVGDNASGLQPVYIKPGDVVNLQFAKEGSRLFGENTPENETLFRWEAIANPLRYPSLYGHGIYTDVFPELEKVSAQKDGFKASVATANPRFNELMVKYVDFTTDFYAMYMVLSPRREHAQRSDWPEYYSAIENMERYSDEVLFDMPWGERIITIYPTYRIMSRGGSYSFDEILNAFSNDRIRGEILISNALRAKSYNDFQKFAERPDVKLTAKQQERMDGIGAELYDTKPGTAAIDFTYPDLEGNMVSLSDFKGKVVLVDVWATWCMPCRQQIPALKELEKEMHGKDVVVMSVSVDVQKDFEKWKKMVADEQLGGVQLFANGWSKITKDYKITGIPRFMLFDKQGNIVDVNAPRPSDPELKKLIEAELAK